MAAGDHNDDTPPRHGDIDVRVLGRLFPYMLLLEALPVVETTAEFLEAVLSDIPGVKSCEVRLEAAGSSEDAPDHDLTSTRWVIPIATGSRSYGALLIEVADERDLAPYHPFLVNLAGSVGVLTENRWRRDQLGQALAALREERDRFARIVATAPGAICQFRQGLDGSASFPYASPAVRDVYGLQPEDLAQDASIMRTLIHPDDLKHVRDTITESARTLSPWRDEYRFRHPKKGEVWIESHFMPEREPDGSTVWYGIIVDITERRRTEEKIRRLNVELEQRVLDRTAQLDAANKELEAFAYSVAHDLRAPLRHVSGFANVLAEVAGDSLNEEGRHCLDTIEAAVHEMGVLIDDLLQFSSTGRAELRITDVDMDQALSEALAPLQRETQGRDIEWSVAPLPHAMGDPALLRQVWASLLDNAVKYSRDRMPARIEVGALDREGDSGEAVFFVRDNGVGFDMQYADKIFGVFERLHGSAGFEGTGIGLANVQRIITRLGGHVWAEAELDHGATFSFSLPRRKEAP